MRERHSSECCAFYSSINAAFFFSFVQFCHRFCCYDVHSNSACIDNNNNVGNWKAASEKSSKKRRSFCCWSNFFPLKLALFVTVWLRERRRRRRKKGHSNLLQRRHSMIVTVYTNLGNNNNNKRETREKKQLLVETSHVIKAIKDLGRFSVTEIEKMSSFFPLPMEERERKGGESFAYHNNN